MLALSARLNNVFRCVLGVSINKSYLVTAKHKLTGKYSDIAVPLIVQHVVYLHRKLQRSEGIRRM